MLPLVKMLLMLGVGTGVGFSGPHSGDTPPSDLPNRGLSSRGLSVFEAVTQKLKEWKTKPPSNPFANETIPKTACRRSSGGTNASEPSAETSLWICVSFSLPDSVLQSLYADAQKLGGQLVMRGLLDNSFVKTGARLQKLGISVVLHPQLFQDYQVDSVPTFLYQESLTQESRTWKKLRGNVPLSHAWKRFHESCASCWDSY
jgi:type-F conjugative transfer system pilin assembly protein TrbC